MSTSVESAAYTGEIVDSHHHLWDLGRGHYPWLQDEYDPGRFFLGTYETLRRNYLPADYRRDTHGYRVAATVHIEAERSRKQQVEETAWIEHINKLDNIPTAIVAHVFFTQPDRDEILAAHAHSPLMRGVRSKPVVAESARHSVKGQPGTMQDVKWLTGLATLEGYGWSWDARVPYWHLGELADTVRQFPYILVALNHAGLPLDRSEEGLKQWRSGLHAVASNRQVTLKLSEFGLGYGRWDEDVIQSIVRDCVAIFGFDRVMFGSNLPVSSLSASFDRIVRTTIAALPLASAAELHGLFAGNARRFYRIDAYAGAAALS